MRSLKLLSATLAVSAALCQITWAGTWQSQQDGSWKYLCDDGTYMTGWISDGGKSYYLDKNGVMLTDTVTPDGYYVGSDGAWNGMEAGYPLATETSAPATVIGPGTYKVGEEIEAGEYALLQDGDYIGYYSVSSDETGEYDSIITNRYFRYNAIITVEAGQYLTFINSNLSPISEVPQISCTEGSMFKVGYHIPPGEYRLLATEDTIYFAYYAINSSSSGRLSDMVSSETFHKQANITLKDGQYLEIRNCILTR